jgi:hypothetical protein
MFSRRDVRVRRRGLRVRLEVRGSDHTALVLVVRVGVGVVERGLEGHGVDEARSLRCSQSQVKEMCASTTAKADRETGWVWRVSREENGRRNGMGG